MPGPAAVPDHAELVASSVDDSARLRRVLAVVRAMPTAEREAVELCLLGELSTAEAAVVLGVAEVTVRSRISRARARLRAALNEEVS
nr:hypothetical protein GCM10017745_31050 [Saccharothrix mutabilis subsp. capreolus]